MGDEKLVRYLFKQLKICILISARKKKKKEVLLELLGGEFFWSIQEEFVPMGLDGFRHQNVQVFNPALSNF